MSISLNNILKKLPAEDKTDFRSKNKELFQKLNRTCVVIDDDPTGNQTVYNVPLLTKWDVETIANEFEKQTPIFFILTNSRSLTTHKSTEVYKEIAKNISEASKLTERDFSMISRSDSTLRGHFPSEIDAIMQGGHMEEALTVFIPVMFEGGRVTVNDTHYVSDGVDLTPVNETPFAQDHSFGYSKANLKEWIEEKTGGRVKAFEVQAISVVEIRMLDIQLLSQRIREIPYGSYCIINALNYQDLDKISKALLTVERYGKKIVYRTSSSFMPSYIGLAPKALLKSNDIIDSKNKNGGLTIVGSYVPKSSEQLKSALTQFEKEAIIEINVVEVLNENAEEYVQNITVKIDEKLARGKDVLVFTSRTLITGKNIDENLNIGKKVSKALIQIVKNLQIRPKYLIAKGGITAHDLAVKGLGMERSKVLGQISSGIPVWEMGRATRFPKLPYIVFPGNVGDDKSLVTIIQRLT